MNAMLQGYAQYSVLFYGYYNSQRAIGWLKFRMPQESHTMMGERVDPGLPLEKQVYVL